ncbi:MAG: hypothetical protein ACI4XG_28595, partial [Bradyrhizobium sp.]
AHEMTSYLQRLRGVRINMEFNSALCRGLLAARNGEPDVDKAGGASRTACAACGSGCAGQSVALPVVSAEKHSIVPS